MKKIFLIKAITAACLFVPLASQAASPVSTTFNVTVNLIPECIIVAPISGLVFPTYTAFGGVQTASTSITVRCTRGLTPVNAGFDDDIGIGAIGDPPSTASFIGGAGVINGLQYTLFGSRVNTPGTAATNLIIGSGDQKVFTITGNIPAGQAGAVPATSPQTRTFRVTY
jgi:spore coat protein U-like protein